MNEIKKLESIFLIQKKRERKEVTFELSRSLELDVLDGDFAGDGEGAEMDRRSVGGRGGSAGPSLAKAEAFAEHGVDESVTLGVILGVGEVFDEIPGTDSGGEWTEGRW